LVTCTSGEVVKQHRRLFILLAVGWFGIASGLRASEGSPAVPLQEAPRSGDGVIQSRLVAVGSGKLIVPGKSGKLERLEARLEARIVYEERAIGDAETVRLIEDAAVGALVGGHKTIRRLRNSVRLLRCRRSEGAVQIWSPLGLLSYDEAELLRTPFDTICIAELLPPDGTVREGRTWRIASDAVAAALRLDRVVGGELKAVCEAIRADTVEVRVAGTVRGEYNLAPTRITVNAQLSYDRAQQIVTRVVADIDEIKSPGPIDAGFEGKTRLTVTRSVQQPKGLTEELLDQATADGAKRLAEWFVYEHPKGLFRFEYPRVWRVHFSDERNLILKWPGRDAVLAQCNVVVGHRASPGTHVDRARVRQTVEKGLGDRLQRVLEDRELSILPGIWVHRLAVAGLAGNDPVLWYYYTLADRTGQHILVVFSIPAQHSARFGTADLSIIETFRMQGGNASEAASREPEPGPAATRK